MIEITQKNLSNAFILDYLTAKAHLWFYYNYTANSARKVCNIGEFCNFLSSCCMNDPR